MFLWEISCILVFVKMDAWVYGWTPLQEWTRWEDNCGRLGRLLDDLEAFISSGEPEGDDEGLAQHRQDACQVKTLSHCSQTLHVFVVSPTTHSL